MRYMSLLGNTPERGFMAKEIIKKADMKEAMALMPEETRNLIHKTELISDLSYQIALMEKVSAERDTAKRALRAKVSRETMGLLGAMNGEYRFMSGHSLFQEFIDYKHIDTLPKDKREKTLLQMAQAISIADECCREIWADYLEAEGDEYMKKKA